MSVYLKEELSGCVHQLEGAPPTSGLCKPPPPCCPCESECADSGPDGQSITTLYTVWAADIMPRRSMTVNAATNA